jgi:L-amino acid N-acyltransferase YncA
VAALYEGYVRDSLATFELVAPTPDDWRSKLEGLDQVSLPFLVASSATSYWATPW